MQYMSSSISALYRDMIAPLPADGIEEVADVANKIVNETIRHQVEKGKNKYNTTLHTFNGRNVGADLIQEIIDTAMYATQQTIEHQVMMAVLRIIILAGVADHIIPIYLHAAIIEAMPYATALQILKEHGNA